MLDLTDPKRRVVGLKQTIRALQGGHVQTVYLALDADAAIRERVLALCTQAGIQAVTLPTMRELGSRCAIDIGAAVAAVIERS